ncbi:tRNA epoxyqueuosine(34) reductase QueG [Notoacmeibacter sp. MSK16QG-6]|uniref:tRNA epoxyqueuosine(34) reductase QueG n=1 Tax=Notoacmeibacter sp. MSK16QG-6 TaxID=2957982 RepID=UPI00209F4F61|nr:tRNA epoxyqueuosine(34) reductase QueG [Notoacmeibacter sp. MSK16QG-6]MCP1198842.1 tRNA epoxyqueuosine(34) reductase QueG [Notoacmeibacter sp. MSK16QG-6]
MRTPTSSGPERAEKLGAFLKKEATALGFDGVAITAPDAIPDAAGRLAHFVSEGRHGTMGWMAETAGRRGRPTSLWPDVRSVIMLSVNYGPDHDPLPLLTRTDRANISVYARHRDYHDLIKGRLKTLASKLLARARQMNAEDRSEVKVFVDTAPLMEKPLAEAAGLGWQGKHTNLVSRTHGSWLFLGAILTTLDLPMDEAEADHCGSCRACLNICPTDAFPAPYQLDARRCISYLTIEHDGPIPMEFRQKMGNRIYGCDDCLAICPWNKFASETKEAKLAARHDLTAPPLADFLGMDDAHFRTFFSGSPVKRIGRDRFVRNALIAAGNSDHEPLVPLVVDLLDDPSPQIRAMAVWALSRLDRDRLSCHQGRADAERDDDVRAEWRNAFPQNRTGTGGA